MKQIILAAADQDALTDFSSALAQTSGLEIIPASTREEALAAAGDMNALLVVLDGQMDGTGGKQLLMDIINTNAMINSAVMGDMPDDQFHEEMEGLGILMQLPLKPTAADAQGLWQYFKEVNAFLFDGDNLK
jgi:DNA-binding NtrC family response regulator